MPTESVKCDILFNFDNSQRVITSGQSLSGQVVLTFFKQKYLLGIFMNVVGKATIKFSKGNGRNKRIFAWEEIYIDEEINLVNGGDFLPDVYSYPFECYLSPGFPSSVESLYGNIRYYVSVVLLNSSWNDRTYKKEFTLIKPLDLNLYEFLRHSDVFKGFLFDISERLVQNLIASYCVYVILNRVHETGINCFVLVNLNLKQIEQQTKTVMNLCRRNSIEGNLIFIIDKFLEERKQVNLKIVPYPVISKFVERFNISCLLCCFKTDPLFVTTVIPYSGYSPNQTIALRIQVINESDQPIEKFSVKLIQFFEYTDLVDNDVVKVKENVLVEHGFNSPFERVEVYNVDILVPDVPPSDSTSSKVIRLSYKLRVHGHIDNACRRDVFLEIPITIGTVPLRFARADQLQPSTSQLQDNDYSSESLLLTDANPSGELDPPTYDEAVIM